MAKTEITVIEDDDDLINLIQGALRANGYEVKTRHHWDGHPGIMLSDLYIIDVNLGARMTGIEICRELKTHSGDKPRVILISANPDLRQLALEACADDTLAKPFSARELLEKISTLLPVA